jgi:DUF1680 family protein
MFVATGKASYLDVYETVLYNAYAVGLSADGTAFFYDNPLQRRPDHEQRSGAEDGGELLRRAWFGCPCCPPNIVRWMSELQDHIAVARDNILYVGVYADARIAAGDLAVIVSTDYPWDGEITLTVEEAPAEERTINLRIPRWAPSAVIGVEPVVPREVAWATRIDPARARAADGAAAVRDGGWVAVRRAFVPGDVVRLTLPMAPRAHGSHPYLDATRGVIAVARGPLVYCVEQQDVDAPVDDLLVTPSAVGTAIARERDDHLVLELTGGVAAAPAPELYPVITEQTRQSAVRQVPVTLSPYFLWGNRQALAMRVWLRTEREG